jgi:hypothetical protein
MDQLHCTQCGARISDRRVKARAATLAQAKRQERKGGRPTVLHPCPWCGLQFGFRALREHRPLCPQKPEARGGRPRKSVQTLKK